MPGAHGGGSSSGSSNPAFEDISLIAPRASSRFHLSRFLAIYVAISSSPKVSSRYHSSNYLPEDKEVILPIIHYRYQIGSDIFHIPVSLEEHSNNLLSEKLYSIVFKRMRIKGLDRGT